MTESTQSPSGGENGADITSLVALRTSVKASKTMTIAETWDRLEKLKGVTIFGLGVLMVVDAQD